VTDLHGPTITGTNQTPVLPPTKHKTPFRLFSGHPINHRQFSRWLRTLGLRELTAFSCMQPLYVNRVLRRLLGNGRDRSRHGERDGHDDHCAPGGSTCGARADHSGATGPV